MCYKVIHPKFGFMNVKQKMRIKSNDDMEWKNILLIYKKNFCRSIK